MDLENKNSLNAHAFELVLKLQAAALSKLLLGLSGHNVLHAHDNESRRDLILAVPV